jgi:hypothetical protein
LIQSDGTSLWFTGNGNAGFAGSASGTNAVVEQVAAGGEILTDNANFIEYTTGTFANAGALAAAIGGVGE